MSTYIQGAVDNIRTWMVANAIPVTILLSGVGYVLVQKILSAPKRLTRPKDAEFVGRIKEVCIFPVKAAKKLANIESAIVDNMGLKSNDGRGIRDRCWSVTDERGNLMRARAEPRLTLIEPTITPDGQYLKLDAPGMPTLTVSTNLTPQDTPTLLAKAWHIKSDAVDCGSEASKWLDKFLGHDGFKLAYLHSSMGGRQVNTGLIIFHHAFADKDKITFAECAPVHLIGEASIEDLNSRISEGDISDKNFRPSFSVEGSKAYDEDYWDRVYIGDSVVLENRIIGGRCLVTNVDHDKGTKLKDNEPLNTLAKYRPMVLNSFPSIGIFMNVQQTGLVKTGDPVYITRIKGELRMDYSTILKS